MTREQIIARAEAAIAFYRDGKKVECKSFFRDKWDEIRVSNPGFDLNCDYRIVPEPEYVPFSFHDREQLRGRWVKMKADAREFQIIGFADDSDKQDVWIGDEWYSWQHLFDEFEFLDGSLFGKEREAK